MQLKKNTCDILTIFGLLFVLFFFFVAGVKRVAHIGSEFGTLTRKLTMTLRNKDSGTGTYTEKEMVEHDSTIVSPLTTSPRRSKQSKHHKHVTWANNTNSVNRNMQISANIPTPLTVTNSETTSGQIIGQESGQSMQTSRQTAIAVTPLETTREEAETEAADPRQGVREGTDIDTTNMRAPTVDTLESPMVAPMAGAIGALSNTITNTVTNTSSNSNTSTNKTSINRNMARASGKLDPNEMTPQTNVTNVTNSSPQTVILSPQTPSHTNPLARGQYSRGYHGGSRSVIQMRNGGGGTGGASVDRESISTTATVAGRDQTRSASHYASVIIHNKVSVGSRDSGGGGVLQESMNDSKHENENEDMNVNSNGDEEKKSGEDENDGDDSDGPIPGKRKQMRQMSHDLQDYFKQGASLKSSKNENSKTKKALKRQNTFDAVQEKIMELELNKQRDEEHEQKLNEIAAQKLLSRSHTAPDAILAKANASFDSNSNHSNDQIIGKTHSLHSQRSETEYKGIVDEQGRRISRTNDARESRMHSVEKKQKEEFYANNPHREFGEHKYKNTQRNNNVKKGKNQSTPTKFLKLWKNSQLEKKARDINVNTEFWAGQSNGGTLYKILNDIDRMENEIFTPSAMLEPFEDRRDLRAKRRARMAKHREKQRQRQQRQQHKMQRDSSKSGKSSRSPRSSRTPRSSRSPRFSNQNGILRAFSSLSFGAPRSSSNMTMRVVSSATDGTDNDHEHEHDIDHGHEDENEHGRRHELPMETNSYNPSQNLNNLHNFQNHHHVHLKAHSLGVKPGLQILNNYPESGAGSNPSSATTTLRSGNSTSNILMLGDQGSMYSTNVDEAMTAYEPSTNVDSPTNTTGFSNSNSKSRSKNLGLKLNPFNRSKSSPYGSNNPNISSNTSNTTSNGLEFQIGDTTLRALLQEKLQNITGSKRSVLSEPMMGPVTITPAVSVGNKSDNYNNYNHNHENFGNDRVPRTVTLSVDDGYKTDDEENDICAIDESKDEEKAERIGKGKGKGKGNGNGKELQLTDTHSDNRQNSSIKSGMISGKQLRKVRSQNRVHFDADVIRKDETNHGRMVTLSTSTGFSSTLGDIDFTTKKKLNYSISNAHLMKQWNFRNDKSINSICSDGHIVIGSIHDAHLRAKSDPSMNSMANKESTDGLSYMT